MTYQRKTLSLILGALMMISLAGCGGDGSSSSTAAVNPAAVDPTTGFSKETIHVQLAHNIRSPYQLVAIIEPYVSPVLDNLSDAYANSPVDQLGTLPTLPTDGTLPSVDLSADTAISRVTSAIQTGLIEVMPDASELALAEMQTFLLNYFFRNG